MMMLVKREEEKGTERGWRAGGNEGRDEGADGCVEGCSGVGVDGFSGRDDAGVSTGGVGAGGDEGAIISAIDSVIDWIVSVIGLITIVPSGRIVCWTGAGTPAPDGPPPEKAPGEPPERAGVVVCDETKLMVAVCWLSVCATLSEAKEPVAAM